MALPPPPPSILTPSLLGDQISFGSPAAPAGGLIMGYPPNTPYGLTGNLEGIDKPDVRSGNQDRAQTRGAFIGTNQLKTRTITATMDVGGDPAVFGDLATTLGNLSAAVSTEGDTEYPLWIQVPNFPLVCCMARVLKHNAKWNVTADLGNLAQGVSVQWEATDSYLYSAPTQNPTVGLSSASGGLAFPLLFPLSFGSGTSPTQITAVNDGDVACWPMLVIAGPCLNPIVQNQSVAGAPTIALSAQLFSGDLLYVDCDTHAITYYPSGSDVGVPQGGWLNPGSTFFGLPPGTNVVSFASQDSSPVAGTLTMWYASAYSGLL